AGMQYTLTYDYASELLDSSGSITVSVDGQALSGCPSTSQSDTGLDWREASVTFAGTGGPQTIQLTSGAKGVMLGDLWLAEQPVNTGYQDTAIRLQPIDAELVDRGGSENLSLTLKGLPVGAMLTDGTNSFTATADQNSVDITDWWGGNLSLTPPSGFYGTISLTLTATATAPSNGSEASVTQSLPVTVLAAPTAVASTVTTPENTPYVFQWSDFQVSDAQTQGTPLAVDMSTWCQGGGHLEFLTTDGWETASNNLTVTKADVDAGKLRFVPDPDATGFSGYGGTDLGNLQSTYTLFMYSAFDGGMFSDPVAMNIDVIPVATAPTITLDGGGNPVNTGYENTAIQLQQIDGELVDRGGSETLSVTIEGVPVGAVLTDGTNTFTATAGLTTADVTNWNTGCLSITPPTDFYGTIPLTVRATSTAPSNGSTASATQAITVTVEQGSYTSPLVIDLTGQGIQTVGLSMTGGTFDLLDTGRAIHSGWIASGNAFLAVDTNGNGTIDNRSELFGGEQGQGFAELAKFDTNRDGVINAADQDFGKLLIWQDLNGDHRSEPGELMSLSQAGIDSISLHDTVEPQLQNGNRILERSVVTMGDGRTLQMADVYFETDAAEAAQAQAQSDAVPVAPVPATTKHRASITVQSLLNARDPIVAPVRHASLTSGRMVRPPEASSTPTPQRILPDIDLRQPWDQAAAVPSAEAPTSTPVIDWSRRGAPLTERFPEIPVHAPWAVDFLGVNASPQRDLGRLTGLSMRIPETPNRANSV
ncbi:MAG: hypothetical protein JWL65_3228, partial [Gammaproteobacteria bacterium]|nr:hypothetical protein [Gammaproteobacteria bacterium]